MTQETKITLRQGLDEFYRAYKDYHSHSEEGISNEAKAFFKSHDIVHVLFGCDISLYGEGSVKIWTIFGTTLGFCNHIRGYREANAFRLSRNFSFSHVVSNIFKLLFSVPALILKARKMKKRWPWTGFEPYLDTPISDIRKEFNIRVS
ncbi:hypothetical protein [Muriicola soli]|uniref:Coenzyme Q (Ubiquinone) biosynthesis protein Coq4 n=1 Tax=Muriicola soli TaxID=2507538 RepID=A0A411E8E4_9FLAO|nr:hypothetical protein [Muriicola soli]QBA64005.1 hypothetical protein EQY75_05310 [Muriicola soli]